MNLKLLAIALALSSAHVNAMDNDKDDLIIEGSDNGKLVRITDLSYLGNDNQDDFLMLLDKELDTVEKNVALYENESNQITLNRSIFKQNKEEFYLAAKKYVTDFTQELNRMIQKSTKVKRELNDVLNKEMRPNFLLSFTAELNFLNNKLTNLNIDIKNEITSVKLEIERMEIFDEKAYWLIKDKFDHIMDMIENQENK